MSAYHRAAAGRAWWRTLVELLLVAVLWFIASVVLITIAIATAQVKKLDELDNTSSLFVALSTMALFLPATLLAARITGRKAGMLSSVVGRLRWRWLLRCLGFALVANVVWVGAFVVLTAILGDHEAAHEGTKAVATSTGDDGNLVQFLVLVFLLVPVQAAGEEYLFRGTLIQAVGRFIGTWPAAAIVSTVGFTAAHGALSTASVEIIAMGLVLSWLTVRTGGLEAAIGNHVVNNLLVFSMRALSHGGESIDSKHLNDGATWGAIIGQTIGLAVYATLVVRSWKKQPATLSSTQSAPAVADQIEQHAAERRVSVEHADHGGDAEALAPEQQEPRG